MAKAKRLMGVQQILLSPDAETEALLEYLCQQSGKLYNSGLYFARQLFFKSGKLLTGKFDLAYEPSNNFGFWILDFRLGERRELGRWWRRGEQISPLSQSKI